jgi:chromosome segregation ATPase
LYSHYDKEEARLKRYEQALNELTGDPYEINTLVTELQDDIAECSKYMRWLKKKIAQKEAE